MTGQNDWSKRLFKTTVQNDCSKRLFKTIVQNDSSKNLLRKKTVEIFFEQLLLKKSQIEQLISMHRRKIIFDNTMNGLEVS